MIRKNLLFSPCVATLVCNIAWAEPCNDGIAVSSPTPRFTVVNETAVDRRTGLEWLRCPAGYTFDDSDTVDEPHDDACTESGSLNLSWTEAFGSAEDKNATASAGEPTDWRVPNIKELLSIVERQCVNPAINEVIFPQPVSTFTSLVWSATYRNDLVSGPRAYALDFGNGSPTLQQRGNDAGRYKVLLVRGSGN